VGAHEHCFGEIGANALGDLPRRGAHFRTAPHVATR
jgi:hypothetical protein